MTADPSRHIDRAVGAIDRMLDHPTQFSPEASYGDMDMVGSQPCWRCDSYEEIQPSGLCRGCRMWLTEVSDVDPKAVAERYSITWEWEDLGDLSVPTYTEILREAMSELNAAWGTRFREACQAAIEQMRALASSDLQGIRGVVADDVLFDDMSPAGDTGAMNVWGQSEPDPITQTTLERCVAEARQADAAPPPLPPWGSAEDDVPGGPGGRHRFLSLPGESAEHDVPGGS